LPSPFLLCRLRDFIADGGAITQNNSKAFELNCKNMGECYLTVPVSGNIKRVWSGHGLKLAAFDLISGLAF